MTSVPDMHRFVVAVSLALVAATLACEGEDSGTAPPPPPPNSWVQKRSVPGGPLSGAVSFVIRDKLYVGTGIRNNYTGAFYEYDPARDSWREVASFPGGVRANAVAFTIGDYGYVGLGYNCLGAGLCTFHYFNDLWLYDPQTNLWVGMGDFPGTPRAYASSFVIGGKAYVTGGSTVNDFDTWEYDATTNRWTRKADYPGRCHSRGTALSLGGQGYVGFGYTDGTCKDFWRYDPVANAWTELPMLPAMARYHPVNFSLTNIAYIVGGSNSPQYLTDMWTYRPANNAWTQVQTSYPGRGRSQMVSGVVGGRVFMGMGTNSETGGPSDRFDDWWEYIPAP